MRTLIALLILVASDACKSQTVEHRHNRIDDINTTEQADTFLKSILGKGYNNYYVPKVIAYKDSVFNALVSKANPLPFVKADFDQNGYTDLLVIEKNKNGDSNPDKTLILAILDSGENRFYVRPVPYLTNRLALSVVKEIDSTPVVLYYHYKHLSEDYHKSKRQSKSTFGIIVDTFMFEFDDFIKYNRNTVNYSIHKIEFETTGCFGWCPVFKVTIEESRYATYTARLFNEDSSCHSVSGEFSGVIDSSHYEPIAALLKGINFERLRNGYAVDWTDDQAGTLTITYNSNKMKIIHDYGLQGTFSLVQLYKMLFDLRLNQNWY